MGESKYCPFLRPNARQIASVYVKDCEVNRMENEAGYKPQEDIVYAFFVHGLVPEFMPGFAFRREKHFKTVGQKIIKCPYCHKAFITVEESEKVEIYPHSKKAKVVYHEAMSCKTCRRMVGIIYAARIA